MLLSKFAELTGYSPAAVRGKIREGVWREGYEVRRAPDGHWLVDIKGYERWAAGQAKAA